MHLSNISDRPEVRESIALALKEDLGDVGVDVTSESLVSAEALAEAHMVARQHCVISGVGVAKEVFLQVNRSLVVDMHVVDGTTVDAEKKYVVSGWATVGSQAAGRPVWEVVADYLRLKGTVKLSKLNTPKLVGVKGNPGIADYPDLS